MGQLAKEKNMCKNNAIKVGIKNLDFGKAKGRMLVSLSDGREVSVPVSLFPDIKKLSVKKRNNWMILDDQFFTFDSLSKIYSIEDIMKVS